MNMPGLKVVPVFIFQKLFFDLFLHLITKSLVNEFNDYPTRRVTVNANDDSSVKWELWAKPQSTRKTINYSVSISADGQEKTENYSLILPAVSYYDVSGLSLNKTHLTLQKGKSERLVASLQTQNGWQEAQKYEVRWSSSNPSVVSVDANGNVTAKKSGTATIKAYTADYKKYKTCAVTVRTRPTTDLDLWGLSGLVYKNMNSYKGKTIEYIFTTANSNGLYGTNEKFYDGTITKNEYYRTELGGFKVDDTFYDNESGLYAASYLDCNDGIVIAYRGSNLAFTDPDLWTDVDFATFDFLDPQFYQASLKRVIQMKSV